MDPNEQQDDNQLAESYSDDYDNGPNFNLQTAFYASEQIMENVNCSLAALSGALDHMERRTDDILAQLRALLESNRDLRRAFDEEQQSGARGGHGDHDARI